VPLLAKVAADQDTVAEVAQAAAKAGADAVVVGHGPPGLTIDEGTLLPRLGRAPARLTGPALLPITLRCVWTVHAALPDVPVVACGGVRTSTDAVAALAAGASAVQVGAAVLHDPLTPERVRDGLEEELGRRGVAAVPELVGAAHRHDTRETDDTGGEA
jgi:dihydroorotate dehydrogenase (NAD+) catalytic subunit